MAGLTDWRVMSTQSTAAYIGGGAVGGGGRFNFEIGDGHGSNFSGTYNGLGGGIGLGLEVPGGAIVRGIMDVYMPTIRGLLNSVASQDLYCSNLFSVIPTDLDWTMFNDRLFIVAIGAELGGSIGGNLLIWQRFYNIYNISARTGARYASEEGQVVALAVTAGWGVGLYGASGTFTICSCSRFSPA